MLEAALSVIGILFIFVVAIGIAIYTKQKKIDAPYEGILVVEHQDDGEPALVYFNARRDPKAFTDGQEIKLKVRVYIDKAQEKQRS